MARRFSHEFIADLNGLAPSTSFVNQPPMKIKNRSVVQLQSSLNGAACFSKK
jgi:hypothetical protein